jgi:phage tail sheath protein FI
MPTYTTPGVYIEEIAANGPIQGVGTSTAAFIGQALQGPLRAPTKITSWTQFKNTFGSYIASPRRYMAYAVDNFFRSGGTVAYIVRVGTATDAFLDLNDRGATNSIHVEAQQEGTAGNAINVQVQEAQIVTAATALRVQATTVSGANNLITVTSASDAAQFQPGDVITIDGTTERAAISRISGVQIFLQSILSAAYGAGQTVRMGNLVPTQTTFRVANLNGLEAGSVIQITQGGTNEKVVVDKVQAGFVTLSKGLANTYTMGGGDAAVTIQSFEFNMIIRNTGLPDETFSKLAMDPRHSRYFGKIVSSASVTVSLANPPSAATPPDNRPKVIGATNLTGGTNDDLTAIGAPGYQDGIDSLKVVQDANILCIPDRTDASVQQALITHCETMGDRVCILDSIPGAPAYGAGSVSQQRAGLQSTSGFAALYYPWISISDPQSSTGDQLMIPPSGALAGIYARVDQQRGVHKAPANEIINVASSLEKVFTEADMGQLNIAGINMIRTFPNRTQPTVWGARTTTDPDQAPWRYVNVRRLFCYVESSIKLSLGWAVFEPNDLSLWQKLIRTISEFLTRVWKSGALFGATADQAFYVKCDAELNPPSVRALGQVFVEIGMAPVRPAEFVVVRIGIWDDGSSSTTS